MNRRNHPLAQIPRQRPHPAPPPIRRASKNHIFSPLGTPTTNQFNPAGNRSNSKGVVLPFLSGAPSRRATRGSGSSSTLRLRRLMSPKVPPGSCYSPACCRDVSAGRSRPSWCRRLRSCSRPALSQIYSTDAWQTRRRSRQDGYCLEAGGRPGTRRLRKSIEREATKWPTS